MKRIMIISEDEMAYILKEVLHCSESNVEVKKLEEPEGGIEIVITQDFVVDDIL